ncbi:MAG: hypothetical protein ABI175_08510, partial [Polyangiales bacterium]
MRALIAVALAAVPALLVGPAAFAEGDLKTEPTTKQTPGELSTTKDTSTTLTPGTGTIKKPPTGTVTATVSASATDSASASGSTSASDAPPQPSTSTTSEQPTAFERHKVSLVVGDFALSVGAPGNWPKMADADLPTVDATGTEDAKVEIIVKKGWGFHQPDAKPPKVAEVVVVCGKTTGEYWGDTIRDAAFTQMLDAVEKEAQNYTTLKDIEPDPVRNEGARIVQPFHADAPFSGDGSAKVDLKEAGDQGKKAGKTLSTVKLQGVSFFAFKDEGSNPPTLLACTVTCAHLVAEGDKGICGSVIQSLEVSGSFAPPPKASWFAEMMFAFKRDSTTAWLVVIGVVFAIALLVVLLVMLLRKKKTPATTLTGTHDVHDEEEGFHAGYEAGLAAARASSGAQAPAQNAAPP